jgi:ribosomal protein S18 acetylase RimI-like enzyme
MLRVFPIESGDDMHIIRELFWEYLQWANNEVKDNYGARFDFDIKSMLENDINNFRIFLPPHGRLFLAEYDGGVAGMGGVRKLKDDIGEITRMYVISAYRGKGIGKALLEHLLVEASEIGYSKIWIDSAGFMKAAHALYRSYGLQEIEYYPESAIPEELQSNWLFMEKML